VFVSARRGDYDIVDSDTDIDSYSGGLYYRYEAGLDWVFAALYAGTQEAKVKTDDRVASFKTDGLELGGNVELGRTIALVNHWRAEPSLSLTYKQIDFDSAQDNVGKTYQWDTLRYGEVEAGVKFAKAFDQATVYVKPSVIQTFTGGDKVKITGLNRLDTYKDETLGRVEIGGSYAFTSSISAEIWGSYSLGKEYQAGAGGVGVRYTF
jgi:outer membrane autotransporter protein